jgi:ATP-binding cassette subfamily C (CFTR/MRP) protein 1
MVCYLPPQDFPYSSDNATGYYIKAAGTLNFAVMATCTAMYAFFSTAPQYWLKWWSEADNDDLWFYLAGYIGLALLAWISTNGTMWYAVQ